MKPDPEKANQLRIAAEIYETGADHRTLEVDGSTAPFFAPEIAIYGGYRIEIKPQEFPPPPEGRAAPPAPDWKIFSFALNAGGLPPLEVAAMLSQPGVRIDKLIYRAGAWSIEGVMYAK